MEGRITKVLSQMFIMKQLTGLRCRQSLVELEYLPLEHLVSLLECLVSLLELDHHELCCYASQCLVCLLSLYCPQS